MKAKALLTITVISLLTFLLGWFLNDKLYSSNIQAASDKTPIESFIDTISEADTLKIKKIDDYQNKISGRFILAESNCAGFDFINKNKVLWTNEIACFDPDTLNIRWLDNATFMTRSTQRVNQGCPPRVDIYKVVLFDGKHLVLNSIYTGWNDSGDSKLEFRKQTE
jgi:hypothetical protein